MLWRVLAKTMDYRGSGCCMSVEGFRRKREGEQGKEIFTATEGSRRREE